MHPLAACADQAAVFEDRNRSVHLIDLMVQIEIGDAYGPGTNGGIEAWQRSQQLPLTGYLTAVESDRLKNQALAMLDGRTPTSKSSPPVAGATSLPAQPSHQSPAISGSTESSTRSPASPIKAGTVFWLSASGIGHTVIVSSVPQAGVIRVDFNISSANAAEFCERKDQLQAGTAKHRLCVEMSRSKSGKIDSLLINCRAQTITTGGEVSREVMKRP